MTWTATGRAADSLLAVHTSGPTELTRNWKICETHTSKEREIELATSVSPVPDLLKEFLHVNLLPLHFHHPWML